LHSTNNIQLAKHFDVSYVGSYVEENKCPQDIRPEFAFIGRSNVGKSSLINLLFDNKYLAKVSGSPGKTQTINYFDINGKWYAVDLPGFGYAKVAKTLREKWQRFISYYLRNRGTLQCVFILLDSNIPLQKIDNDFIIWMGENGIPFAIIFTKCDKSSPTKLELNLSSIKNELLKEWEELPTCFVTSADKKIGSEELIAFMEDIVDGFYKMVESPKK
jgi:GTP-binding protein